MSISDMPVTIPTANKSPDKAPRPPSVTINSVEHFMMAIDIPLRAPVIAINRTIGILAKAL